MRTNFAWYLGSTSREAQDRAWTQGVLTVDANVLLDLYRYHNATCESILNAIESFGDRVWIANQVGAEFFDNRKKVISSADKVFRDAQLAITELEKAVGSAVTKLRGFRLVPRPATDALGSALSESMSEASARIREASETHPNYLREDLILERVLNIFDGRTGAVLDLEKRQALIEEGEARRQAQVPPGYMDDDKEGDRKYGDFLLWSEVMSYAADKKLPIILVTSERKEDWWEKDAGKTLGPRPEMLKEFYDKTGQDIFIYQTDFFLKLASERAGSSVAQEVVEDIREVDAQRNIRKYLGSAPAVEVIHVDYIAEPDQNIGFLEIELLREVRSMTGSGHFEPSMISIPDVRATVVAAPEGAPPLRVAAKTGTTFDFNVHIHSAERDRHLPVGVYRVEYEAICVSRVDASAIVSSDNLMGPIDDD